MRPENRLLHGHRTGPAQAADGARCEDSVDAFYQRLSLRTATIDELLSAAFAVALNPAVDCDLAAQRLAAWRQSSAAGDVSLFARRLARDGLSGGEVESRFTGAQRGPSAPHPAWLEDAIWIEAALQASKAKPGAVLAYPFEDLFAVLIERAAAMVWSGLDATKPGNFDEAAHACLQDVLLAAVTELCAPAIYERFAKKRNAGPGFKAAKLPGDPVGTSQYREFIAEMRSGGFRGLFEDKPVLLRLIAVTTRQWIDATREFILRLVGDLPAIRRDLINGSASKIVDIASGLSDPHNDGRRVLIVRFADGARIVYKPKDLQLDVAWRGLVERLNGAGAPIALKTVRTLAQDGYGWTEFIEHLGCADARGCETFFRRAGAWLALLHCFAATDMHQENMLAAGDHPVPIDLETILQPSAEEHKGGEPETAAFDAAMEIIGNSVMTVGLLPAYGRSVDNNVFAMGGMLGGIPGAMTADWGARTVIKWNNLNTDAMRPTKVEEASSGTPNLPHVDGRYAKLTDHIESFVTGFADYANFLMRQMRDRKAAALLDSFAGLPVRKVVRPTRFYYMLL
jgi:type 2 lantibiotic biosynthesis protein LanM